MTPALGLGVMAACFAAGALACLMARWAPRSAVVIGHLGVLAGAIAGGGVALALLIGGPVEPLRIALPELFPFARMSLAVDGLSAFFLLVVSVVAASAALYGPAYLTTRFFKKRQPDKPKEITTVRTDESIVLARVLQESLLKRINGYRGQRVTE